MNRFTLIAALLFLAIGHIAGAQHAFRVLPKNFNADKKQQMMRAWLRGKVHAALDDRLKGLESALEAEESLRAYQERLRKFMKWTLGEMPRRNPLNARVTGKIDEVGYTIENILFESQPGFHVTANVYRPKGDGPFPAILHPCGHSENGKAYESYQKANRLLAQNGFVVLCFDPIGQGERKQIVDSTGRPVIRGSGEHQNLGVAPILLGSGLGSFMVWDGVRAIDYLCSRTDVDPKRIGCTGNSGGGNLTSYLMAYDERIAAAAPGCFMTTHRRKNESPGPGDAEQNLYAQIRDGFDHPDFIIARAPKPTLILAATKDFVPIEGTWEAVRQAKRVYTKLGFPERIDLIETNEKHGYSKRLREGAVRFFARWLQGREIEAFEEGTVPIRTEMELQASPEGQVLRMEGARSMFDLFIDRERELAAKRRPLSEEIIQKVAGVRPLSKLPRPEIEKIDGGSPVRLVLSPEPGISLPALHWSSGDKQPILMTPSRGMNSAADEARKLNDAGHPVLIVEVRDTGETRTRNWRFFGADYYIALMLGRSWLGMQCEDMLVAGRWLAREQGAISIRLVAESEVGPAALHAAALGGRLIAHARIEGSVLSWRDLMTATEAHPHIHNAVHGALGFYDLPDLAKRIAPERLTARFRTKAE